LPKSWTHYPVVDADIIDQYGEETSCIYGFRLVSRMGHFFIFFDIFLIFLLTRLKIELKTLLKKSEVRE